MTTRTRRWIVSAAAAGLMLAAAASPAVIGQDRGDAAAQGSMRAYRPSVPGTQLVTCRASAGGDGRCPDPDAGRQRRRRRRGRGRRAQRGRAAVVRHRRQRLRHLFRQGHRTGALTVDGRRGPQGAARVGDDRGDAEPGRHGGDGARQPRRAGRAARPLRLQAVEGRAGTGDPLRQRGPSDSPGVGQWHRRPARLLPEVRDERPRIPAGRPGAGSRRALQESRLRGHADPARRRRAGGARQEGDPSAGTAGRRRSLLQGRHRQGHRRLLRRQRRRDDARRSRRPTPRSGPRRCTPPTAATTSTATR